MLDALAHYFSSAATQSPWPIRAAVVLTSAAALLIVVYLWLVPNSIMVCTSSTLDMPLRN